jgi:hypothetical protein
MPAFKKRMTEDQRWQLVLLVRSFGAPPAEKKPNTPASSQPEAGKTPASGPTN